MEPEPEPEAEPGVVPILRTAAAAAAVVGGEGQRVVWNEENLLQNEAERPVRASRLPLICMVAKSEALFRTANCMGAGDRCGEEWTLWWLTGW